MKKVLTTFCLLGAALTSTAAPIFEGRFSTDAAFTNLLATKGVTLPADEKFVAQVRSGRPLNADYEVGLHIPPNFTSAAPVGTPGQITWVSGTPVAFTLSRTGSTVRLQSGTYDASWTNAFVDDVNMFGIRGRADNAGSSTLVSNLVFNGKALGQNVNAVGAGGVDIIVFSNIKGDFTLTGNTTLTWTGSLPTGSRLGFQLKGLIAEEVPEPSTFVIGGLALAVLAVGRRRLA